MLSGVSIYTMYNGSSAQIAQWCNFHINAGAEKLFVLLDRCESVAVAGVLNHPKIDLLYMSEEEWAEIYPGLEVNVEAKQVSGFYAAARAASSLGLEYLAFVDADELIKLNRPFLKIVASCPTRVSVFKLSVAEMWRSRADDPDAPFGATLALSSVADSRRANWFKILGDRAAFTRDGFMGHRAGKSIYRIPLDVEEVTVHGPLGKDMLLDEYELSTEEGRLLHFDSGNFETWRGKWLSRISGVTIATGLSPKRRQQQRYFETILSRSERDQKLFFQEFYEIEENNVDYLKINGIISRENVCSEVIYPISTAVEDEDKSLDSNLFDDVVKNAFQFAFVSDINFVKPTYASILSVLSALEGRGAVNIVILGDGLRDIDIELLKSIEGVCSDISISIHDITRNLDDDIGKKDSKRATFGRVYLMDYLPRRRTIYLDGDVLATRDFTELFSLDLEGACVAGVPDSAALRTVHDAATVPAEQQLRIRNVTGGQSNIENYLNGGVLILDLENPDFDSLMRKARSMVVHFGPNLIQRDQDAFNMAFSGRTYLLDAKYNYMTQFYTSDRAASENISQRKYGAADAVFIHFSGKVKPWISKDSEFYNGLYRRLVAELESKFNVSCDFYFSGVDKPSIKSLGKNRVRRLLSSERHSTGSIMEGLELVDFCETGAYLRVSASAYAALSKRPYFLAFWRGGEFLFDVSLCDLGPAKVLLGGALPGVRKLVCDMKRYQSVLENSARKIDVCLSLQSGGESKFSRTLRRCSFLHTLGDHSSEKLPTQHMDGVIEKISENKVRGWLRSESGWQNPISVYANNELIAIVVPDQRRDDLVGSGGSGYGFEFDFTLYMLRSSKQFPLVVDCRVAGTGIRLRRSPIVVVGNGDYKYDRTANLWTTT